MLQPTATLRATGGMVCAVDHLAAQAGVAMLRSGGTAGDAAVATSAVLAVTTQNQCGMGGDLLAVVCPPDGQPVALSAAGFAGSGADAERLREQGHKAMPLRDHISTVTVPGCVDGWLALHERFGALDLATVLEPGRRYAEEGFPASPALVADIADVSHLPEALDFTAKGALRPGFVVCRPGVARALRAIARSGRSGFYGGEFGEGLIAVGKGEFWAEDLVTPIATWKPALRAGVWGKDIWTVPPGSQGYLTLAAAVIAAGLDLPGDIDDPVWPHALVESVRQASFDRIDVLHEGANGEALLAEDRLAARRSAIDLQRAAQLGGTFRDGGTIALTAVDGNGMGISLLQSSASGFGSRIAVPGVRIFLHNRGMGFSLDRGHPAEYGAGRRPPHTLSPTLVTYPGGALYAVLGAAGGDSQPQFLLQVLVRLLIGGQDCGDTLAGARWSLANRGGGEFNTWAGRGQVRLLLEGHAPPAWRDELSKRGHLVEHGPSFDRMFGLAHVITAERGHLAGATEPRSRFGAVAAF